MTREIVATLIHTVYAMRVAPEHRGRNLTTGCCDVSSPYGSEMETGRVDLRADRVGSGRR